MNIAFRHPRTVIVVGVAVALALVALVPGTWGTAVAQTAGAPTATVPPPPPPAVVTVTVVVNGNTETIATTPDGLASITIPPGSQITSIELTVTTSPSEVSGTVDASAQAVTDFIEANGGTVEDLSNQLTGVSGGQVVLGYVFQISFGGAAAALGVGPQLVMNGGALAQMQLPSDAFQAGPTELAVAATGRLNVLPETLAQVGGDLSRLFVVYVDPANGVIEPVTMLPSPGAGVLAFEFTKEGAYAIMVAPIVGEDAPSGSGVVPSPADTGMGIEESGATNPLAIALGVVALAGVLGLGARLAMGRRSA